MIRLNQGKKFAKPDLKSSVEEFEEKLNKFHLEKKEQEATARNAQAHRNKVGSLEGANVDGRNEENSAADTSEGTCFRFCFDLPSIPKFVVCAL